MTKGIPGNSVYIKDELDMALYQPLTCLIAKEIEIQTMIVYIKELKNGKVVQGNV